MLKKFSVTLKLSTACVCVRGEIFFHTSQVTKTYFHACTLLPLSQLVFQRQTRLANKNTQKKFSCFLQRKYEASVFFPQEFARPHLRRILIILRLVSVPYVHTGMLYTCASAVYEHLQQLL